MTLLKRLHKWWYTYRTLHHRLHHEWQARYWYEHDGFNVIPCRLCPKYHAQSQTCSIHFGSRIRKCIIAATEANLRHYKHMHVLEIGCGENSYAKQIVERLGSTWTGIDPRPGKGRKTSVRTSYGHAAQLPFADETFDVVFGIQTFEHFTENHPHIPVPSQYDTCLEEVWRVLKPDGWFYFDAPMHLHGHAMFILGDTDSLKALFKSTHWHNLRFEKWRYDHAPLPKWPAPPKESSKWFQTITGCDTNRLLDLADHASVWLLTITGQKTAHPRHSPPGVHG